MGYPLFVLAYAKSPAHIFPPHSQQAFLRVAASYHDPFFCFFSMSSSFESD